MLCGLFWGWHVWGMTPGDTPCPEQLEALLLWSAATPEVMLEDLKEKFSLTETKPDPYKAVSEQAV